MSNLPTRLYEYMTDGENFYNFGGKGWLNGSEVTAAEYNSKQMLIYYTRSGFEIETTDYLATLEKQKNGGYKLTKIEER